MRTLLVLLALVGPLTACQKDRAPEAAPRPEAPPPPPPTSPPVSAEEGCVDRWLAERKLDPYGNPLDTMYAGGSPLFDERTGTTVDRLAFVYQRQPGARAACGGDAG